jgi:pimeloyl-ACP methyl ester carboxylesterase
VSLADALPGQRGLPEALPAQRVMVDSPRAGRLAVYAAGPAASTLPPLLLVHSVNAAATAAEVRPIYEHAAQSRPVYALELPGYGHSERSPRAYTIRLMTDAVLDAVAFVAARHRSSTGIDLLALSLGCEFVARAAVESPESRIRRLVFVSPTGLTGKAGARAGHGPTESALGPRWLRRALPGSAFGRLLFRGLTRPGVIRYFLRRTWGSEAIDERMFAHCVATARQPGAEHAPLAFVSGALFAADAAALYTRLSQPIWMPHGTRGDFTDYRGATAIAAARPNWQLHAMATGAFPHFEQPGDFCARMDAFLQS